MVGCSAVGCSNRRDQGFAMRCFPKDPARRREWAINMKRENWTPTDYSVICEVHFTPDMWEKLREDGKKKLKWNAVPTLFSFSNSKKGRKLSSRKCGTNLEVKSTQSTVEEQVDAPNTSQVQGRLAAKRKKSMPTIIRMPQARKKAVTCTQTPLKEHLQAPSTSQVHQQPVENAKNEQCGSLDQKMNGLTVDQFDKTCRTCLSQPEELLSIFAVTYENIHLWEMFRTCLCIEVEKDSTLPQHICKSCIGRLVQVHVFKQQCQQSNNILRTILKKHTKSIQLACDNRQKQIKQEIIDFKVEIEDHSYAQLLDHVENVQEENNTLNEENNLLKALLKKDNEGEQSSCNNREGKNDQESCSFENNALVKHDRLGEKQTRNEDEKKQKKKLHRQENHPTPSDRKCSECGKMYSKAGLRQHMITHKEERRFVCHVCGKTFRFPRSFLRHTMIHTGEKPYMCEICGKCFTQSRALTEHRWIHTGEKPHVCSCCGRGFKQLSKLRSHLTLHYFKSNDANVEEDTNTELHELCVFECDICFKRFISQDVLDTHQQVHRKKPFSCNQCGKNFVSNARLLFHMKIHTRDKLYKCPVCNKTFTQSGSMKAHMVIHTGEKPFLCKLCPKTFAQRSYLYYHMRTAHSGERPYACTYCDQTFAIKRNMIVHTRTHTGPAPFICGVCEKGFYSSSTMKKHRRTHIGSKNNDKE